MSITDSQYRLAKDQERAKAIKSDRRRIDEALDSNNEAILQSVHINIDGKYSAYIRDWGKGMYNYGLECGFDYDFMGESALRHNLVLMKAKLEGFALNFEQQNNHTYAPNNNVNVNVSNTNEVNFSLSFNDARKQIEDMTSLTDQATAEIKAKIDELEKIITGTEKKKTKWEKAKPLLIWLADKSFDVGLVILPLLLKIQGTM